MKMHPDHAVSAKSIFTPDSLPFSGVLFYTSEPLKLTFFAEVENGSLNGVLRRWYSDGTPEVKAAYKNGKLHGHYICFYPDGKTQMLRQYRNGILLMGEAIDTAGRFRNRENYDNRGLKQGLHVTYYDEGGIKSQVYYKNDVLHGEKKVWYPDGSLKSVQYYVNGEEEGRHCWYLPEGLMYLQRSYKNGRLHGKEVRKDSNCTVLFVRKYENGRLILDAE